MVRRYRRTPNLRRVWIAAIFLSGLFAVPWPSSGDETPRLSLVRTDFAKGETIYVAVWNVSPAKKGPPLWIGVMQAGDPRSRHVSRLDLQRLAPRGDFNRWYALEPLPTGSYEVRLMRAHYVLARTGFRVAEGGAAGTATRSYADVLVEYVAGGGTRHEEPFGMLQGVIKIQKVDPAIVLGDPGPGPFTSRRNPELEFLVLPKGSSVTVGFSKVAILDRPGPDLAIRGLDPDDSAGEIAAVYVSSNLVDYHFVGDVAEAGAQLLDLEPLNLREPVIAVKVVGTDFGGRFPGFDLVSVEAINYANSASFPKPEARN
jgi:hypothetical protein